MILSIFYYKYINGLLTFNIYNSKIFPYLSDEFIIYINETVHNPRNTINYGRTLTPHNDENLDIYYSIIGRSTVILDDSSTYTHIQLNI